METMVAMFATTAPVAGAGAAGGAGAFTSLATAKAAAVAPAAATFSASSVFSGAAGLLADVSTMDLISGGLTALSAISSYQAGEAEAQAMELSAQMAGIRATSEELQGRRDAVLAKDKYIADINANLARGFGAGLQSSGSVAQASEDAKRSADLATDLTRSGAEIRALSEQQKGEIDKVRAASARSRGISGALGTVAQFGMRYERRG